MKMWWMLLDKHGHEIGGGEGNRTPVREHSVQQPYVCSR